jgi:hypothetical protein
MTRYAIKLRNGSLIDRECNVWAFVHKSLAATPTRPPFVPFASREDVNAYIAQMLRDVSSSPATYEQTVRDFEGFELMEITHD